MSASCFCFFTVLTSKPVKQEADVNMTLPGTVAQDQALDIPDEQRVAIAGNGQIVLNDQPMDSPQSKELPSFLATLKRFKESCKANKTDAMVTVDVADEATHQRIVDVLNVCALADINGVTFAGATEEDP
jgi:biopolymer transport protein ExbD